MTNELFCQRYWLGEIQEIENESLTPKPPDMNQHLKIAALFKSMAFLRYFKERQKHGKKTHLLTV